MAVDPRACLGTGDELLHHVADVVDVKPGSVKGAVGGRRSRAPRRSAPGHARAANRRAPPRAQRHPCQGSSRGVAGRTGSPHRSTSSSVAAAPLARKPEPNQPRSSSEVTSSAAITTTRRQRPARIQSSASATAWVVLAHAELICVFGPRAPMRSANWEWPIDRTWNRKRRSKPYGLVVDQLAEVVQSDGRSRRAPRQRRRLRRGWLRIVSSSARSSRRVWSATKARDSSANSSTPGNAEAKITPVSSRSSSGRPQRSGR